MNAHMAKKCGTWALALAITAVTAETTSFLGLRLLDLPTAIVNPPKSEKLPWGAWGVPNTVSRKTAGCFDVAYHYNSVGARDKERSLQGTDRWIFVGDSFVEGFGIAEEERVSDLLEVFTDREMLNFSSSGNFGPLQYKILYEQLAAKHEHKGIVVGLLPDNDFVDNDPGWWNENKSKKHWLRHRPYYELASDAGSFGVRYGVHGKSVPRDDFDVAPALPAKDALGRVMQLSEGNMRSTVKRLAQHSSFFALIQMVSARIGAKKRELSAPETGTGYFTTNVSALRATELILDEMAQGAADKSRIILVFPRDSDFSQQKTLGKQGSEEFVAFLTNIASIGWKVIDLSQVPALQAMPDTTLGCNSHWNAAANRAAAEYLRTEVEW